MQIAVVSDTHLQIPDKELQTVYNRFLAPADVLVHLGDMVGESVCAFFHQHPCLYCVRGNCDYGTWAEDIPAKRSFVIEGCRIGAAHGWGPRSLVWKTVADSFGSGYDLVLYGHTHIRALHQIKEGPQVCNPGSLCAPRDGKGGCALISLEAGTVVDISWIDIPF